MQWVMRSPRRGFVAASTAAVLLASRRSSAQTNIKKVTFTNTGGYVNEKMDALFIQTRSAGDPAARKTAFAAVQRILVEGVLQIWLMALNFPTVADKRLHNVSQYGTGVTSNFDDVFYA